MPQICDNDDANYYETSDTAFDDWQTLIEAGVPDKRERRKPAPKFEPEGRKLAPRSKQKTAKHDTNSSYEVTKEDQRAKENTLIKEYYKMVCELCDYAFETFLDVRHHYRQVHDKAGYLSCCNKRLFNRSSVLDHIRVHLNPDTFRYMNKILNLK